MSDSEAPLAGIVPVEPGHSVAAPCVGQMLEHEQTRAPDLLQLVPGLSVPLIGLPICFDGERSTPRSGPPRLGEHTQIVFGEVNIK